jgi:RNA polymerase sigma-70 factor (ECF subfamily)
LLREDATFEMPPQPFWFSSRELIVRFLQSRVLTETGRFLMLPTSANGTAAFAAYERAAGGSYLAHGIQVLTTDGASIIGIVSFNDAHLVKKFGLPAKLTGRPATAAARRS